MQWPTYLDPVSFALTIIIKYVLIEIITQKLKKETFKQKLLFSRRGDYLARWDGDNLDTNKYSMALRWFQHGVILRICNGTCQIQALLTKIGF